MTENETSTLNNTLSQFKLPKKWQIISVSINTFWYKHLQITLLFQHGSFATKRRGLEQKNKFKLNDA